MSRITMPHQGVLLKLFWQQFRRYRVEQAFYACGRSHKTSGVSHCGNTVQARRAKALRASVSRRPCTTNKRHPAKRRVSGLFSSLRREIRQALVRNAPVPPGTTDSSPVTFPRCACAPKESGRSGIYPRPSEAKGRVSKEKASSLRRRPARSAAEAL
jgi:hypothetical protein